jgi:DNA-binding transcriptional LysR family regulator
MLQTLTLDQMRTFVAVAEAGSFRAAAVRVSRVQSAVSHAIANLETELGVALFDRTGHRPALTVEGRALLEDARAILLRVDRLRARSQGFSEGVEIVLSLVADGLFPIGRLTAALKRMHEQFPSVSVSLAIEPLGAPLQALQEHRADLAIIVGEEFRVPEVELEVLATLPMLAVVAADHPLAAKADHVAVADLAAHLQIVLEDPSALTRGRDIGVLSPETWRVRSQAAKHALMRVSAGAVSLFGKSAAISIGGVSCASMPRRWGTTAQPRSPPFWRGAATKRSGRPRAPFAIPSDRGQPRIKAPAGRAARLSGSFDIVKLWHSTPSGNCSPTGHS